MGLGDGVGEGRGEGVGDERLLGGGEPGGELGGWLGSGPGAVTLGVGDGVGVGLRRVFGRWLAGELARSGRCWAAEPAGAAAELVGVGHCAATGTGWVRCLASEMANASEAASKMAAATTVTARAWDTLPELPARGPILASRRLVTGELARRLSGSEAARAVIAAACWRAGSAESETSRLSSPPTQVMARALSPIGSCCRPTAGYRSGRGSAAHQIAVHHSAGYPAPPITATTVA